MTTSDRRRQRLKPPLTGAAYAAEIGTVECHLGDGTALGPRRASVAYLLLRWASFPDLLLVVCRGRVLASHWMTVELLHIRIVARDGRPRGSSFTGGVAFRRGPPFRYLPLSSHPSDV